MGLFSFSVNAYNTVMKILGFAGSLRKDSFNKKLLQVAMSFAKARNIEIEIFDLENIPIYSYDVQLKGFPKSVINFKTAIKSADLLLIASPEYNYSVSGALKNAIDWASRPEDENVFSNKVAIIFGASIGRFGTVRGQIELRKILTALNVWVLPAPQIMLTF